MMAPRKPTLMERLAKLAEAWKVVVATIACLVVLGVKLEDWQSGMARASDVSALRAEVNRASVRSDNVDQALRDLKAELQKIDKRLFEIAIATGARQPPSPTGP